MSIMDELKKLTRPYDDDGTMVDDELDDMDTGLDDAAFTRSAAPQSQPAPQPQPQPQPAQPQAANPITMGGMGMGGMGSVNREPQRSSVNPMGQSFGQNAAKSQVVIVTFNEWDNKRVKKAAECFCNGASVILDLETVESDEKVQRFVDFFTGCAFALKGNMYEASKRTYIVAPVSVDMESDKSNKSKEEDEDEA